MRAFNCYIWKHLDNWDKKGTVEDLMTAVKRLRIIWDMPVVQRNNETSITTLDGTPWHLGEQTPALSVERKSLHLTEQEKKWYPDAETQLRETMNVDLEEFSAETLAKDLYPYHNKVLQEDGDDETGTVRVEKPDHWQSQLPLTISHLGMVALRKRLSKHDALAVSVAPS